MGRRPVPFAALVAVLALGLPGTAAGQSTSPEPEYSSHEHSATAAGFIEWFVPTAGYAYGGDWTSGFLSNAVRVGSFIGFGVTYDDTNESCSGSCTAWTIAWLGSTVWAVVGAVSTAKEHNERVRSARDAVTLTPAPFGGVSVGLSLRH